MRVSFLAVLTIIGGVQAAPSYHIETPPNLEARAQPGEVTKDPTQNGGAQRFVLTHSPIVVTRMDPIVNPGKIGGHVHQIFGASNFRSVLNTPEEQRKSSCVGPDVQDDKSLYWAPTLYFIQPDGKYKPITGGVRTYYMGPSDTSIGTYLTPFPKGFRMISGTAMSRYDNDIKTLGVAHDYYATGSQAPNATGKFLPNGTNTGGKVPSTIRTMITFPSCGWANQTLDTNNHFDHMTWPIEAGGGHGWYAPRIGSKCPASHPIKYATIFMEVIYRLTDEMQAQWKANPAVEKVTLSNGDRLGSSFHADFVNGWDPAVLSEALKCSVDSSTLKDCPALAKSLIQGHRGRCVHEGMQPDENVGLWSPIPDLPGANCRWGAEMGPNKPTNCKSTQEPGWTYPNIFLSDRDSYSNTGYLIPAQLAANENMDPSALTAKYKAMVAGKNVDVRNCITNGRDLPTVLVNFENIKCAANQDIYDNLILTEAKNKIDNTANSYSNRITQTPVGQSTWRIFPFKSIPNDQCWTGSARASDTNCITSSDDIKKYYVQ